ncbi:MAG TPA: DCC1-like thiol-disulfide oxidoreductase family protein [Chthoniobacteraceae bacterium]|jgi:predicted DCC family thiol-disulfide oxidoreductase YuxK
MTRLYILYDAECALCRSCRVWLSQQPAYLPLIFIPLQSPEIGCRFPGVEQLRPAEELVVIADDGCVWRGDAAWITALWALKEYREWSQRLASPVLRPFARRACALVSQNRQALSGWLAKSSDGEIRTHLSVPRDVPCRDNSYCKTR